MYINKETNSKRYWIYLQLIYPIYLSLVFPTPRQDLSVFAIVIRNIYLYFSCLQTILARLLHVNSIHVVDPSTMTFPFSEGTIRFGVIFGSYMEIRIFPDHSTNESHLNHLNYIIIFNTLHNCNKLLVIEISLYS